MARAIVEIFELIDYVNGGSRPFEEGSRIVNSNNILLCGLCNSSLASDKYFALCLKTTSPNNYPHEISITINVKNKKKLFEAHCTCQAGASGKCKHIVAVLLYLNKRTKDSVEQLGCTDLRQQWGQIKEKVNEAYAAEEFNKFCHGTQSKKDYEKSPDVQKQIMKILCEADIESELSQHTRCYRSSLKETAESATLPLPKRIMKLLNNNTSNTTVAPEICDFNDVYARKNAINESALETFIKNNIWSKYLNDFKMTISCQEQAMYFSQFVSLKAEQSKEILLQTVMQNNDTWLQERKKRITGSICYNLYTFMKNNHNKNEWEKKLNSTYKSSFKGNKHTHRDKVDEDKARKAYEKKTNTSVQEIGLLILPSTSWFGYSADGIVDHKILLEFKCPKNDAGVTADVLALTLPYINKNKLKVRHAYYGQIQLGMCLLDLQRCHFVVYEGNNDSCAIFEVERDDSFITDLVTTLSSCYFTYILPWLLDNQTNSATKEN